MRARPEPATEPSREAPVLGDPEFRLLREFIQRSAELPAAAVTRHTAALVARFAERFPDRRSDDLGFLQTLYQEELARRQGKFAARAIHPGRETSGKSAASSVERMVARKADRWRAFQTMAERVTRGGLDALSARELPEFAARYREVAADLARARTYGADPVTLGQLERLVAAGHNALYRSGRNTWRSIGDFMLRQCPAAVIQARRYVLLAGTVFTLSAIGGFALLREKPALAPELLPDVVLERAEAGIARTAQGQGYVVSEPGSRPIVASSIITNNIQVAFSCFAGGIFLGVGALVMLAFNGLLIGAVSAHFANAGLLGYLYTFVIGHSVLEVFAIWVSGAAGFLLGRALIAPGPLRRADALVLAGRQAVRMVGAAVLILFVAGSIEGFVSAGGYSVGLRLVVSAASVVLLGLYLLNGWKRATEHR